MSVIRLLRRAILLPVAAAVLSIWASIGSAQTAPCRTTSWTLNDQHINVGTLTVQNDNTNLYVTYKLDDSDPTRCNLWNIALVVGTDLTLVDGGGLVRPRPGKLPYQFDATGLREYTFTIPFAKIPNVDGAPVCPISLYVVAHAEVEQVKESSMGAIAVKRPSVVTRRVRELLGGSTPNTASAATRACRPSAPARLRSARAAGSSRPNRRATQQIRSFRPSA